jgi:putative membrane protein
MIGSTSSLGDTLAAVNATLNGISGLLVAAGWLAIRNGRRTERHRKLMLSAVGVSAVFLVSYLTRIAISGTHRYPGSGPIKTVYLAILLSHVTLAIATVPLVLGAVWLAARQRFDGHKRIVAYTLPIWLYVSVTGVIVYLMLYQALGQTLATGGA